MMQGMTRYLDLDTWPRRAAFDYFRRFDKPYFNVCTRIDVAALKAAVAGSGGGISLACAYLALQLANAAEPFRLRLEAGRVRVYEAVQGSTTVLRDDESIAFAYLDPAGGWRDFMASAQASIAAARDPRSSFDPRLDDPALIHLTSLPWVHFTSFSHARNWGREDSVPKLAFGRLAADGERLWMPLSVEVHHGLMDGLHVGRYIEAFEAAAAAPADWLADA